MTSAEPIRLYWWRDKPNFGDVMSKGIVGHVLGRPVEWAAEHKCDMFAIGSILHRTNAVPPRNTRPIAWGSGHTKPVNADVAERVELIAVRGPITASYLDLKTIAMGDPGLFAGDLLQDSPAKEYRVGIVPNHAQARDFQKALGATASDVLVINPATKDFLSVIRQIAACEVVLSSSLHGLVVADALGIPNRWIDPFGIGHAARLKYYDYALAIGRDLGTPVAVAGIADEVKAGSLRKMSELPYLAGIERCKADLLAALMASRLGPLARPR